MNPNSMYANIGKHYYADNFHQATKIIQDIGVGSSALSPRQKIFPTRRLEL
jgi:aromatic ring hydroxylase